MMSNLVYRQKKRWSMRTGISYVDGKKWCRYLKGRVKERWETENSTQGNSILKREQNMQNRKVKL